VIRPIVFASRTDDALEIADAAGQAIHLEKLVRNIVLDCTPLGARKAMSSTSSSTNCGGQQ
jgi:hypothetical protein